MTQEDREQQEHREQPEGIRPRSAAASGHMDRPPRSYRTGPVTVWIRRGAVAVTVAATVLALILYPTLPETIATHYDFSGRADGWGPRSSLFVLLVIFVVMVAGFTWLSHHPRIFNYPRVVTEYNAQDVYRAGEQMMVWLTGALTLLYSGIVLTTVWGVNLGAVTLIGAAGLIGSLVVGFVRIFRAG